MTDTEAQSLPDGIVEVATKYGPMLAYRHDMYVTRSLQLYGEWCEAELALARRVLKPGAVVIDGGANIGVMSRGFAQAVGPQGRVIAVEFHPATARLLAANVLRGLPRPCEVLVAALSAEPGYVAVPPIQLNAQGNFGGLSAGGDAGSAELKVPRVRIDDVFALDRLDFLKLDIEGAEAAALSGARATIARLQPSIYVEIQDRAALAACLDLLQPLGYHAFWHPVPLFRADNHRGHTENVFARTICLNMFCVPGGVTVQGLPPVDRDTPPDILGS